MDTLIFEKNFIALAHINIGVNNLFKAIEFYKKFLGGELIRVFPRFKNRGFASAAGFSENPHNVEVSIAFIKLAKIGVVLELMQYHSPECFLAKFKNEVNRVSGVRHIAIAVSNVDDMLSHVNSIGLKIISNSPNYKPPPIDEVGIDEFYSGSDVDEGPLRKEQIRKSIAGIRYFYCIDIYGVQWEFEQGNGHIWSINVGDENG